MNVKNNDKLLEIIEQCGLDTSEAKTYLALLELGSGTHHDIAKISGLNRTATYGVIERLQEKGIVSTVKKVRKTVLSPIKPQRLLHIQKEHVVALEKHIDELNYLFTSIRKEPYVTFYTGQKGLKTVLDMIVTEAKEVLIYGDGDAFNRSAPELSEHYSHKRKIRGIASKMLLKATPATIATAEKNRKTNTAQSKLVQIRLIPAGYSIVGGFDVFNEKVVMYSYDETNAVVVVDSVIVSRMMRSIFEMLWNMAGMLPLNNNNDSS